MSGSEVFHQATVDETCFNPQASGKGMEVPAVSHGLRGSLETATASIC